MPTYHGEQSIGDVIKRIQNEMDSVGRTYETVVVDDGFEGGTPSTTQPVGGGIMRYPYNIGSGAAIRTGIRQVRGDTLVMVDGDGRHVPEDIPRFLEK